MLDRLTLSYANWHYADQSEDSAVYEPGSCDAGTYGQGSLTPSGHW